MATRTLFAYALGTDLDKVVDVLETRFDALMNERRWRLGDVWVVNQRIPEIPADEQGKFEPAVEWDLGFNLTLPAGSARPVDWAEDVVTIAKTFAELRRETGRDFVIGIHDPKTGKTDDLFLVESDRPDFEKLRSALAGVAKPKSAQKPSPSHQPKDVEGR